MATQESSVLFSLHELRSLEEQRIRDEAEAERRRQEAERQAREAEAQRARDAEEALRRASEEAERELARQRERRAADERVRLREAELRAQAEQHTRLEEARIAAETRAMYEVRHRFPFGRVIAGTLLSVGAVVVALILVMQKRDSEVVKESRAMAARLDADQRELARQQAKERQQFEAQLNDLKQRMKSTRDGSEAASLKKQIEEKRRSGHSRPPRSTPGAPTAKPELKVQPGAFQDPTFGLKLD